MSLNSAPQSHSNSLSESVDKGSIKQESAVNFDQDFESLNSENQGFFSRMSQGAKNIASQAYEGLYKIPLVNRVVGRIEIAFNQSWLNRHDKKALELKNKMDGLDSQSEACVTSEKAIRAVIENLKQQNLPGVASLYSKLNDIDQKRLELLNKKDGMQSKCEMEKDMVKLYEYKRNGIADKLIEHYNLKLEPLTQDLETIQRCKDRLDLAIADMELKHEAKILELKNIENTKIESEKGLRRAGMSEREIRNFETVKALEEILKQGRKEMKSEKEKLARRKSEIDLKIFKINNKISPYKYKQAEFIRGKERKSGINRQSAEKQSGEDENVVDETQSESNEHTEFKEQESPHTDEVEKNPKENIDQPTASFYISEWNNYLKNLREKSGKGMFIGESLDQTIFLRLATVSEKDKLDFAEFTKNVVLYYKIRGIPTDNLDANLKNFLRRKSKKIKVKNK